MPGPVATMLSINAGSHSFKAFNLRHEHEWKVWQDPKLPEGKLMVPGILSHATNVVGHPELVADRIERFASVVGRESVIASTGCGLGGHIHPQIAAAKLATLGDGARIASKRLWTSSGQPSRQRRRPGWDSSTPAAAVIF